MPTDQLTAKQRVFIAAYLGQAAGNAVRAARIAGYSLPEKQGWETLQNPRVKAAIETRLQEIERQGLADKRVRVARQMDRHRRLTEVILARAEAKEFADEPGGQEGLLVRTIKSIGTGFFAREVEEFAVDTGLLAELRALEEMIARELGQRKQQVEMDVRDVSIAEALDRKLAGLFAATGAGEVPGEPHAPGEGGAALPVDLLGPGEAAPAGG